MKEDFLNLEGAKLHYQIKGAGFPLVFVHGLSVDKRMWTPQVDFFAQHFQVISYDVRGFGKSHFTGEAHPHIAADDLKALLEHLGHSKVNLVGLSMGGNIALSFAEKYPESVHKLVAADSDVQGFDNYTDEFKQLLGTVFKIGAEKGGLKAKLAWAKNSLLQPAVQNEHTALMEIMIKDYSGIHLTHPKLLPAAVPPTVQLLDKITAPTCVIVGEKDIEDFQRMADFLVKNIAKVEKKIIKNAGHLSNLEQPEAFNAVLQAFFTD